MIRLPIHLRSCAAVRLRSCSCSTSYYFHSFSTQITAAAEKGSAESTLQSRTVDFYDYLVSPPTNGDLTIAGMDGMETNDYVSRPGVRRRKGLPLSVRQQMKQIRSTRVQSKNEST